MLWNIYRRVVLYLPRTNNALEGVAITSQTLLSFLRGTSWKIYHWAFTSNTRGDYIYFFWYGCTPWKTKGRAPKPGAGFLTNYQAKSGANHICYKNATQSRGKLGFCANWHILRWEKPAEKMDWGQTHVPTPGRFFYFDWKPNPVPGLGRLCKPITVGGVGGGGHPDPLTNTSHPPPLVLTQKRIYRQWLPEQTYDPMPTVLFTAFLFTELYI